MLRAAGGYAWHHQDDPAAGDNAPMAVISLVLAGCRGEIVEDAVATAKKRCAQKRCRRRGQGQKKATTEKAEKADKAEYAGAVRSRGGSH